MRIREYPAGKPDMLKASVYVWVYEMLPIQSVVTPTVGVSGADPG